MTTTTVTESLGALQATERSGLMRLRIITEGQGSSANYPAEGIVASVAAFPAGTHIHYDHPTVTEAQERPERSVLTLAGAFETDAEVVDVEEGGRTVKALETWFRPLPSEYQVIKERKDIIGASIRAAAEVDDDGNVVRITEAHSVDLVTRAGRGGRITEVIESARREIAERNGLDYQPRHAATVTEATSNDVRRYLSDAVDTTYETEDQMAFLEDYDDTYVYVRLVRFDGDSRVRSQFRQAYSLDGVNVSLTGEPHEVRPETVYTPTSPEPDNPVQESTATAGGTMVDINESELSKLRESAERYETEKARADQAEQALAEALAERTRAQAETIVAEAFEGIDAPKAKARLIEAATTGDTFDPEAFKAEAVESAAEFTPAGPTVTGFGNTTPTPASEAETVSDDDIVKILKEAR
ncbi:hypothetical protein [Nesterenkonia sp. K-15-9-6]|uniref:hypothetical protein n=1 Tax=Nesterenkonia sp. K-15-9-6 TaxID=3093918 RepID=UPI004043DD07